MPARLTLMSGELPPEQMMHVEGFHRTRRDIALWFHSEKEERSVPLKVHELIRATVSPFDHEAETYGLDL